MNRLCRNISFYFFIRNIVCLLSLLLLVFFWPKLFALEAGVWNGLVFSFRLVLFTRFCFTLIRFSIFLTSNFPFVARHFSLTTFHIPALFGLLLLLPFSSVLCFYVSERNFHLLFGHAPISRSPPQSLRGRNEWLSLFALYVLCVRGFVFIGIINCSFFFPVTSTWCKKGKTFRRNMAWSPKDIFFWLCPPCLAHHSTCFCNCIATW